MKIDLLIHNAAQLAGCIKSDQPLRGTQMGDAGILTGGAVAVDAGFIVAVGDSADLSGRFQAKRQLNAAGKTVCPGFVDSHTHLVYGGDRVNEFEMRIQGASYMEIMAAGGGIRSTMRQTRAALLPALVESARRRLDQMLALGATTIEIKSGYGLDTATEIKMLQAVERLDLSHPCDLIPTFLGGHTVPPEYADDGEGYVALLIEEMIPAAAAWYAAAHFSDKQTPFFIDVFCENHAFDVAQSKRILEAGIAAGMKPKIHVDQFNALGGLEMALALDAVSVDHLEATGDAGIDRLANSATIAAVLPAANFNLGLTEFAPARQLIDAGAAVALATDMNPGSAPCLSLPLTMGIACRYQRMTPAEAFNASAHNAAFAVGLGDKIGSIAAGKKADLLLLNVPDYRHLPYMLGGNLVETIIKDGVIIREDLF